jgi:hypothetical protein
MGINSGHYFVVDYWGLTSMTFLIVIVFFVLFELGFCRVL